MTGLKITSAIILVGTAIPPLAFTKTSSPAAEERFAVEQSVSRFLRAFEDLEMTTFMSCFTDDATVFFPTPEPPQRFVGKAAIRAHFEQVFLAIRKSSKRFRPPYQQLKPEGQLIQLVDPDAAIVTFHLLNRDRIARRTLVLRKVNRSWLIVHLHASNVPVVIGVLRLSLYQQLMELSSGSTQDESVYCRIGLPPREVTFLSLV